MKLNARFTRHNGLWHVLVTPLDDDCATNLDRLDGYTLLIKRKDGECVETVLGPMCCQTKFQARYTVGLARDEESPVGYIGDDRNFDICSELDFDC